MTVHNLFIFCPKNNDLSNFKDYKDISNSITLDNSYESYIDYAILKSGWIIIRINFKAVAGDATYANISQPYTPQKAVDGFMVCNNTYEFDKLRRITIQTSGDFTLWAGANFEYTERFTFIYPMNS